MDLEWFARKLAQPDVHSHSVAAIFLASQGADGYCHVEPMLARCKSLDLTKKEFDKCEDMLLLSGTRAIAQIVRAVGYDDADQLHRDVSTWIDGLTRFATAKIRGIGVWGLGDLGSPPECVSNRLTDLVMEQRLHDDYEVITCRGIAFRMLARVDRPAASRFVDTPACKEYLSATRKWRADLVQRYPHSTNRLAELDAESAWLQKSG